MYGFAILSRATIWLNSVNGIDPVGQALVHFYPQPNANTSSGNWAASGLGGNNSDEYSARIDHNFSDSTRLYGRYSYKKEFKDVSPAYFGSDNPAGPGQRNPNNRYNIGIGVSHVFAPTFTMSANFGLMHWVEGNDVQSNGFQVSSLGLPAFIDPVSPEYPAVVASGYLGQGPQQGAGQGAFPRAATSGSVDFVKIIGKHQLTFGYMGVAQDENGGRFHTTNFNFDNTFTGGPDPLNLTPNTGDAVAAMLLGTPIGRVPSFLHGDCGLTDLPGLAPWNVFAGRLEGHSEAHSESRNSMGSRAPGYRPFRPTFDI